MQIQNTNTQIQCICKYKIIQMWNRPYKRYIFEKPLIQGCHKLNSKYKKYTNTVYIHLWDIYQLEGVCAPFVCLNIGHGAPFVGMVRECKCCTIYLCIGYMLQTIGG